MQDGNYTGTFKNLHVWQRSRVFVSRLYKLTEKFPSKEQFGLTSQLQRAGVSIPSNIAEGHRRNSDKEFHKFLMMARGSLAEVETQLIIGQDLKYCTEADTKDLFREIDEIGRMINGLINTLNLDD